MPWTDKDSDNLEAIRDVLNPDSGGSGDDPGGCLTMGVGLGVAMVVLGVVYKSGGAIASGISLALIVLVVHLLMSRF